MTQTIKIGTRKSPLALAQTALVKAALSAYSRDISVHSFMTTGDSFLEARLESEGGKGLFTKELDEALLNHEIDIAVHSAKDMPTELPEKLMIGAVLPREDPRDVWITHPVKSLDATPKGSVVGTASLRREAQLRLLRPDFSFALLRGNVNTRLRKIQDNEADATMLALAGLKRLAISPLPGIVMDVETMLPAVGQGIIAITCRTNDISVRRMLEHINHSDTMLCLRCERAFLKALDGSCRTPIAGLARIENDIISLDGFAANNDMRAFAKSTMKESCTQPEILGTQLAEELRKMLCR